MAFFGFMTAPKTAAKVSGLENVEEILNDKPTLAFIKERMERNGSKSYEVQASLVLPSHNKLACDVPHHSSSTQRLPMKLHARNVSVSGFDDLYFQVTFGNENPVAEYDPDAPIRPYVLLQRQFEDDDGGVCYIETHDPDRYAGHLKLRLVEFTPIRLAFEIDRHQNRLVEVTFRLGARRFREVQRVVNIMFGLDV